MRKNKWTDNMIRTLTELYSVETTAYTAACLQLSETAVKNQARKLGLGKIAKSKWMVRADMYGTTSINVLSLKWPKNWVLPR